MSLEEGSSEDKPKISVSRKVTVHSELPSETPGPAAPAWLERESKRLKEARGETYRREFETEQAPSTTPDPEFAGKFGRDDK